MILKGVPDGFLDDLPANDQQAIRAAIGQHVTVLTVDPVLVEVEFVDGDGDTHTIWVPYSMLDDQT